jgi:hypothetical protein
MGGGGNTSFKPYIPPGGNGIGISGCQGGTCISPFVYTNGTGGGIGFSHSFCFSANVKIVVLENNEECKKNVAEIKKGDLVLTFDGNEKIFSKVIETKLNEGIFEFYDIQLKDGKNISVTGNHTMIVFDNNTIKFKYACELKEGDLLRTNDGLHEISKINNEMKYNSYKISTEKGTVLANDVLVSTIYLEGNRNTKTCARLIDSVKIPIEIKN